MQPRSGSPSSGKRRRRAQRGGGIFAAELLLTMPLFMIFLLAVVQFAIFFANMQILALASRVGAEAASESALPLAGPVPGDILSAVEQHLESNGIAWCRVRVEHNVNTLAPVVLVSGDCNCEPQTVLDSPPDGEYVRVSVCVHATELMPNLLVLFGLDMSGPSRIVSNTTVMHYEL